MTLEIPPIRRSLSYRPRILYLTIDDILVLIGVLVVGGFLPKVSYWILFFLSAALLLILMNFFLRHTEATAAERIRFLFEKGRYHPLPDELIVKEYYAERKK